MDVISKAINLLRGAVKLFAVSRPLVNAVLEKREQVFTAYGKNRDIAQGEWLDLLVTGDGKREKFPLMSCCCSRPPAVLSSERVMRSVQSSWNVSGWRMGSEGGHARLRSVYSLSRPTRAEWNTVIQQRGSVGMLIKFLSLSGFVSYLWPFTWHLAVVLC